MLSNVHVDEDELKLVEDVIHITLEHHSGVFEAERHSENSKSPNRVITAVLGIADCSRGICR